MSCRFCLLSVMSHYTRALREKRCKYVQHLEGLGSSHELCSEVCNSKHVSYFSCLRASADILLSFVTSHTSCMLRQLFAVRLVRTAFECHFDVSLLAVTAGRSIYTERWD